MMRDRRRGRTGDVASLKTHQVTMALFGSAHFNSCPFRPAYITHQARACDPPALLGCLHRPPIAFF